MNNKLVTLFLITAALLVAALISLNGEVAWLAVPFLAYLGTSILRSPAVEHVFLQATRTVEQIEGPGKRRFQVTVAVSNQGTSTLDQVCLEDQKKTGMHSVDGRVQQWQSLPAGEVSTLTYSFQTSRGLFAWETVQVVVCDPLGMVETRLNIPAEAALKVHPEMTRFPSLPVRPQRTLHLSGQIPARSGGSGTDFWGIREYHPGDPLRRLDWHHVARHPGRRFTREYEQEEIAEVGLILDARHATDMRVGDDSLFEHSIRATASLAEIFIRMGNRVSLLVYGNPVVSVYPGYGKGHLSQILDTLTSVTTEAGDSLGGLKFLPVRMFSSRSIILIISPLIVGDWRLFPRLRAHGYQVVLISPDPVDFARQTILDDVPSKLALRISQMERRMEIHRITRIWIPVIDWKINQPLPPLVHRALAYSHLQHRR